jgi:hypothetical protein
VEAAEAEEVLAAQAQMVEDKDMETILVLLEQTLFQTLDQVAEAEAETLVVQESARSLIG